MTELKIKLYRMRARVFKPGIQKNGYTIDKFNCTLPSRVKKLATNKKVTVLTNILTQKFSRMVMTDQQRVSNWVDYYLLSILIDFR